MTSNPKTVIATGIAATTLTAAFVLAVAYTFSKDIANRIDQAQNEL